MAEHQLTLVTQWRTPNNRVRIRRHTMTTDGHAYYKLRGLVNHGWFMGATLECSACPESMHLRFSRQDIVGEADHYRSLRNPANTHNAGRLSR